MPRKKSLEGEKKPSNSKAQSSKKSNSNETETSDDVVILSESKPGAGKKKKAALHANKLLREKRNQEKRNKELLEKAKRDEADRVVMTRLRLKQRRMLDEAAVHFNESQFPAPSNSANVDLDCSQAIRIILNSREDCWRLLLENQIFRKTAKNLEVVRKSFLRLAKLVHPDKTDHPQARKAFVVLYASYKKLISV